jgi:hypothetical protein
MKISHLWAFPNLGNLIKVSASFSALPCLKISIFARIIARGLLLKDQKVDKVNLLARKLFDEMSPIEKHLETSINKPKPDF